MYCMYCLNRVVETVFATWGRSTVVRVKGRQKDTVRARYLPSVFNTPHPLKIYLVYSIDKSNTVMMFYKYFVVLKMFR